MKTILLISDSPYSTTGLGRMARYFMKMMPEFKWVHWGVNHPTHIVSKTGTMPKYNKDDFNGNFEIISPQIFNSQQNPIYAFEYLKDAIDLYKPDYLITALDLDRILNYKDLLREAKMIHGFKWINYFPVDRPQVFKQELDMLQYPDINIVITKYGQDIYKKYNDKIDIKQIYHPIDAKEFELKTADKVKEFKESFIKDSKDNPFTIININRNFFRKDLYSSIKAYELFLKNNPNSFYYLHCNLDSQSDNYTFSQLLALKGIPPEKIAFLPSSVSEIQAIKQDKLNDIYLMSDLFITSSLGEGFGFTAVEALLCEIPVIAPHNTSFPELIKDFGYLIPTIDQEILYYGRHQIPWFPIDIKKMSNMIEYVKNNHKEAKERAKKGKMWIKKNLSLKTIEKQWREIIK